MASNQGYGSEYQAPQQGLPSTNPWAEEHSPSQQQQQYASQQPQQQYLPQSQYQQPQQPYQYQQQQHNQQLGFAAPPGPPPGRANTFNETSFVPESEQSEQREALEHFEMNNSKPESQTDRDVAQLATEFPKLDSSLIAALYSDSQNLGATREMLQELAATAQ